MRIYNLNWMKLGRDDGVNFSLNTVTVTLSSTFDDNVIVKSAGASGVEYDGSEIRTSGQQ
jgi:hypothetical protein